MDLDTSPFISEELRQFIKSTDDDNDMTMDERIEDRLEQLKNDLEQKLSNELNYLSKQKKI
jgi:hypothetical protein